MTFNANPSELRLSEDFTPFLERGGLHLASLQEFDIRLDRSTGYRLGHPFIGRFLEGNRFVVSWPEVEGDILLRRPVFSQIAPTEPTEMVPDNPKGRTLEGVWASGGFTRGVYSWQGQPVAVYNVHLHSFGKERPWRGGWRSMISPRAWREALRTFRRDFATRAEQARILRQALDEERLPFIVCGDFNSTRYNWVYAHIARGLRDAFEDAGTGWGGTFPTRFPMFRIDYILVSAEWEVRRAHVLDVVSSDHLPVLAELVLRPQSGAASDSE